MKKSILRARPVRLFVSYLIVFTLFTVSCKRTDDEAAPQGTVVIDPNDMAKVVVIPGATVQEGNPPIPTRTGNEPVITNETPTVEAVSGLESTITINYSNVVGTITAIYIQFEGASNCVKIPITGNTGKSGKINIPITMPAERYTPVGRCIQYCMSAISSNGAGTSTCTPKSCFASQLTPRPGKGSINVNGTTQEATAACDVNFGPYGRGYAILTGQGQGIVLYNMRAGTVQLGNFEQLVANSSTGTISTPFAFYTDGVNVYWSVSGSATVNGKTASASGTFRDILSGRQTTISAAGNCQ